jgi:hypothetical protein
MAAVTQAMFELKVERWTLSVRRFPSMPKGSSPNPKPPPAPTPPKPLPPPEPLPPNPAPVPPVGR